MHCICTKRPLETDHSDVRHEYSDAEEMSDCPEIIGLKCSCASCEVVTKVSSKDNDVVVVKSRCHESGKSRPKLNLFESALTN